MNIPLANLLNAMQNLPNPKNDNFIGGYNFKYVSKDKNDINICFVVNQNTKMWELDLLETFNKNQ